MKFKLGHWMMKPNIEPLYAHEVCRIDNVNGELKMLAAPVHYVGRKNTQIPLIDVRVFSPMEGVIGVEAVHFKGVPDKLPEFKLFNTDYTPDIVIDEAFATVQAGELTAKINLSHDSWNIEYSDSRGYLTSCGQKMLGHMTDTDMKKTYMMGQLGLSVGECVYGLGERFTSFVKNGQSIDIWNGDGGSCSDFAYKNMPFYMTNLGYGVFVDSPADVSFEIATEQVERAQFSVEGEKIRYFVIAGPTPKDVLNRYTLLTGRPALPPAWSFGLWLSTSFTTNYDEKTVTSFIDGMADRDIPLNVFHYDCFWMREFNWCDFEWDKETFPDPMEMLDRYHKRGLHISCWLNPYIAQISPLFDEGMKNGYLVKKKDGSVWQTDLWQAGMGLVDFTNPAAREWYREYLRKLVRMGVDCFKTDFAERIPVRDIEYFDKSDPVRMHNYYTHLYNEAVFSLVEEEKGVGNAVVFARSATTGGQMFPVHWGGDNFATYDSMAETLRAGLSLATCGFGFWSHDISGFESTAPAHVYKRWCQFGMLSSHSRLHGSQTYRVPWLFDEESCDVLRKFTKLKNTLMPYLYEAAVQAHTKGTPVMRPMYMEFPDDPGCDSLDRQYMLGASILVAPIFRENGTVEYYLPEGKWTHLLDNRIVEGGRWMKEKYDFMSLPVWVWENTLLPVGNTDSTAEYDFASGVEIRAYNVTRTVGIAIPDIHGNTAMTVTANYNNGDITFDVQGGKEYTTKVIK